MDSDALKVSRLLYLEKLHHYWRCCACVHSLAQHIAFRSFFCLFDKCSSCFVRPHGVFLFTSDGNSIEYCVAVLLPWVIEEWKSEYLRFAHAAGMFCLLFGSYWAVCGLWIASRLLTTIIKGEDYRWKILYCLRGVEVFIFSYRDWRWSCLIWSGCIVFPLILQTLLAFSFFKCVWCVPAWLD